MQMTLWLSRANQHSADPGDLKHVIENGNKVIKTFSELSKIQDLSKFDNRKTRTKSRRGK